MSKADLKIDWATHAAAKYAVENWHYSENMPKSKLAKLGAWESGKFIGSIIFGVGANNNQAGAYGLGQNQCCELVRVALRNHKNSVSRIVAISLKFIKKAFPGIRLIVSYADPKQGHHGGIYQAGNWIYSGRSQAQSELLVDGVFVHKRTAHDRWGTASPEKIKAKTGKTVEWAPVEWKHVYLMPLDKEMSKQILPLSKPYPKRAGSDTKDTPPHQGGEGGSTPTPALHSNP